MAEYAKYVIGAGNMLVLGGIMGIIYSSSIEETVDKYKIGGFSGMAAIGFLMITAAIVSTCKRSIREESVPLLLRNNVVLPPPNDTVLNVGATHSQEPTTTLQIQ